MDGYTYRQIKIFEDAPRAGPTNGDVRETHRIDFKDKETQPPGASEERAKDIAAFANTLGGIILVGAKHDAGVLSYPGLSRSYAAKLGDDYEQSAKDMCSPVPFATSIVVEIPGVANVLLAVNVDPFVDGVVGCRKKGETDAWRFPVREASHTRFLSPTELPMYMNARVRVIVLRLERALREPSKCLLVWHRGAIQPEKATKCTLLDGGAVQLLLDGRGTVNVPFTEVEDVWPDVSGNWNMKATGSIAPQGANQKVGYLPYFFRPF